MADAFSVHRALNRDHTCIAVGRLDLDDWIGSTIIDPTTLTINTGLKDRRGKEIFTGDYLNARAFLEPGDEVYSHMVYFDADEAAFCTLQYNCRILLNRKCAEKCYIVGSIYDKLLKEV